MATGERVAVGQDTTESSEVFANPDGTFTQEMNAAPVRARGGGGAWAPIDTTLVREADGSVRAKNTTTGLTFSGGGSGDRLVALEDEGHELQLGWPTTLPEPQVDGDTATYAGVLPDVDLKLTALSSGYTSVLVVRTAEAAKNPALATIKMTVSDGGLDIVPTADGGFVARDSNGTPVFESPSGRMWDSAGDASATDTTSTNVVAAQSLAYTDDEPQTEVMAPLPAAGGEPAPSEGPSSGDAAAELPLKVTSTTLEITPDPALLHGADTVFPLYIDPPTKGIALGDWTALSSDGDKFWEFDGNKGVGRCSNYAGYLCSNSPYTQRLYFEYPLSSIHGKKILDATMEVYQEWTFTCDPHWYDLSRVDKGISSSTTWSTRPTGVDLMGDRNVAYGRGGLCSPSQPANWVRFSDNVDEETNENLTTTLASYAANKTSQITFSLTAHDESDAGAWARFRNDAKLSVTYVSYPSTPTPYGVQQGTTGRACNTSTSLPFATSDTTPKMLATVQSADGSNSQLRALFEVWKADGSSRAWYAASPDAAWVADNAVRDASTSALPAQTDYRMRVMTQAYYKTDRGATGVLNSAWSSWCYFRIDTDSPPPPVVTSSDGTYKPAETDPAAGGVGTSGKFTFTPADTNPTTAGIQSDVVSYKWKLNSGAVSGPINVAKGAATTQMITPNQAGENTIQVWGYDAAGHSSLTGYYSFLVKGAEKPSGIWHLDNNGNDSTSAVQHPLTLGGTSAYTTLARSGAGALKLNGTSDYAATSSTVLDTSKSFAVSAWVRPGDTSRSQTVLSQKGTNLSGYALHYSASAGKWAFSKYASDAVGSAAVRSYSTAKPVVNAWTHLAGVYNAADQTIQLFVNGVPQGQPMTGAPAWNATGPMQFGRFHSAGSYVENLNGSVDEVHVWSRAVTDTEITQGARLEDEDISDGTAGDPVPALVAKWDATDMANASGTTVTDTSGFGRNLTLNGAALTKFTTGDPDIGEEVTTTQTISLNGTNAYATANGPVVDDSGSFTATAWVTLDPAKLADTSKSYAVQVFGQSGTSQSSWGVWYEQPAGSTQGRWTFGRPDKDGTGAVWTKSESTAFTTAALGAPVMVSVVYDAQAAANPADTTKLGGLKLYVDSALMGDEDGVAYSAPWQGGGAFEIGRAKINGAGARYYPGKIDSVRVWAGATSTDTIANRRNTEQ
ncbi:LamG-like jellyroll fold domain-containing protein [Streptomyces pratensis]|uniref:LamG domain-containing protein n=1 Tax=Streptomyces pratensis TaxID=1169025 RepID=UPI003B75C658